MRKSSAYREKLYIHENGLCVTGDRIELSKPPKCYAKRNVRIDLGSPSPSSSNVADNRHVEADQRKALKLSVTEYKNLQVCSKQLKQIRRTVEVGDFERILADFRASDEYYKKRTKTSRDILDVVKAGEIYERFFGQHCDYLKNVMVRS